MVLTSSTSNTRRCAIADLVNSRRARRLNAARGPVRVLVPLEGFSEHTRRRACDLDGNDRGPWRNAGDYRIFVDTLKSQLTSAAVEELPLHINDAAFARACVDAFVAIAPPLEHAQPSPSSCDSPSPSAATRPMS